MKCEIRKSEQSQKSERKPYETPAVTDLGQAEELTKGSAASGTDVSTST